MVFNSLFTYFYYSFYEDSMEIHRVLNVLALHF
jgi:hypothetical protein